MAYGDVFHPAGTARDVKVRGPVWVGVFSLVTFGIYAIWWIYVTAKDLGEYGRAKGRDLGQSPGMTLLAVTLGALIIVPAVIAIYRQAKRIQDAQRLAGQEPVMNGWLALVLYLVLAPLFLAYEQSELNKAWAHEGGPVPSVPEGVRAPELHAPETVPAPAETQAPERPVQ